jgi:hypothetical protein
MRIKLIGVFYKSEGELESSPYFYFDKKEDIMGELYRQSWHSKHAGQTVDDAVDRVWELVDQWNDMHARLNIMESELNT